MRPSPAKAADKAGSTDEERNGKALFAVIQRFYDTSNFGATELWSKSTFSKRREGNQRWEDTNVPVPDSCKTPGIAQSHWMVYISSGIQNETSENKRPDWKVNSYALSAG